MSDTYGKEHRIIKRTDFETIYRKGLRFSNAKFRIHILDQEPNSFGRLGLSITKRVGNAVVRNRLKRAIREWFRKKKDTFQGLDIIVSAKTDSVELDASEISKYLDHLISEHQTLQN
jgi:ribonuclease P protein component